MTDCPNAEMRDRLPDLANESLSPALRVVMVSHVAECAACAAEIEILRVVRSVVIEATPAVNVASIVSALPRGHDVRGGRVHALSRGRNWASWRVAAAVTVLAAGAGSFTVIQQRSAGIVQTDSMAVSSVVADSSAGLALTGSLADLNDTELQALVDGLGAIEALPAPDVESETTTLSVPTGVGVPDSVLRDLEGA